MTKQTLDLRNKIQETDNEKQNNGSRLSKGEILISWEAPEYVVYKKNVTWYVGFGIILALLLFSAFLLQSLLTGIVFLLCGILIFVHAEREPKTISYDIRTSGIRIGNRVYLFRELSAFNIVERGGEVYMLLKSKSLLTPLIHIPLDQMDHEEVEKVVSKYLPMDHDFLEPLADVIAHWVGF